MSAHLQDGAADGDLVAATERYLLSDRLPVHHGAVGRTEVFDVRVTIHHEDSGMELRGEIVFQRNRTSGSAADRHLTAQRERGADASGRRRDHDLPRLLAVGSRWLRRLWGFGLAHLRPFDLGP